MHIAVVVVVAALVSGANPASPDAIPEALKPWVPWVLHGAERERCPQRTDGNRVCEEPGRLALGVESKGGTFEQTWRVDVGELVVVPGDARHWPLEVTVDGKPAAVVDAGGAPAVHLEAGERIVRGKFAWDAPPESIPIPVATAIVHLTVDGKDVAFVDRGDAGDRVWLKRDSSDEDREEDRLDVAVFRKIVDGVPLQVETQVLLEVSGKGRSVTLPGALIDGFAPLSLTGTLPARVDGANLVVQVRPGKHSLDFTARRTVDDKTLTAPKPGMGGEGAEEVWVFQADHAVRVANVTGVPSIVAEQTRLPDAWRALPAYRVLPGDKVALDQQKRGDENPPSSQLTLMRTLWLDFDGKGFTVHDEIGGRFTGDRLSMGPDTELGRVATGDGSGDAFITRIHSEGAKSGDVGVEVRNANLRVSADSRMPHAGVAFPAVSWAHDFQSVTELLHLPPGFRLVHASGVDEVDTTWVKSWTLFELFLVVVLTLAMGRLWGPLVGGASLMTFVLTFQENGAIKGLWVVVVALAALHRVLPPAWETRPIATLLKIARLVAAITVALFAIAFAVQQVRVGLYPVLEQEDRRVGDGQMWGRLPYSQDNNGSGAGGVLTLTPTPQEALPAGNAMNGELANAPASGKPMPKVDVGTKNDENSKDGDVDEKQQAQFLSRSVSQGYAGKIAKKSAMLQQIDPNSVVQTGPGLPQWGFTSVTLKFTGPVKADQRIDLVLLGPSVNLALAFLRVLLVAFLVVASFGFPGGRWPTSLVRFFRGRGALWASLIALFAATSARAVEVPPADTLAELKTRLLEAPKCSPGCGSIARVALSAEPASLTMRAEVHALAEVAVPLPGADKQWTAANVAVDGKAWPGVLRDGNALWIVLGPGRHDVVLEGPLPSRDSVQLAFPMLPHRATFQSTSWTVDGIHEDGVPDANLQLSRKAKAERVEGAAEQTVLPAFVAVERSLLLGLSFEVETRVVRLSPPGQAVVLDVPLLPGENVTTEGVRVEKGHALISLGPNDTELLWSGSIPPTTKLELVAATDAPFVESWSLQASPVWHVEETGIPPLHDEVPRGGGARGWRPWPGEKLSLTITRPEGVPGQTVTIEHTTQQVRPGLRSTDVTLTLDLRASRGGEHVVTLPAGAELLSATINGAQQPLRPSGSKVTVPVVPGKQQVVLTGRVPTGISMWFANPELDVGQPSVNGEILIDVPSDRWILFAAGPRAGPAVLFWSFIVVLALAGIGLNRVPFSPLKTRHWILLGLGLTQVPLAVAAMVAGWLLALGWRKHKPDLSPAWFNLRQIVIACWTLAALIGLVVSIKEGLAGAPDMQIAGNGSTQTELRWFADHTSSLLPSGHVLSAPMWTYRVAMLAWALWLAYALLRWLRFGWASFADGGMWKHLPKPPPKPPKPSNIPEAGAPTSVAVPSTTPAPKKEP